MAYMLDTNVCIDFVLGRSLGLLRRMEAQPQGAMTMSAVTYAELAVGADRSRAAVSNQANLAAMTLIVPVRPFDQRAGELYRVIVRKLGIKRNSFDRLIAAHALAVGVTLVTGNMSDFADVPGLKIENWRAE
jgi:tRNA(fMet)-specific endonuclease VapC